MRYRNFIIIAIIIIIIIIIINNNDLLGIYIKYYLHCKQINL
jgi:hypothetical protein